MNSTKPKKTIFISEMGMSIDRCLCPVPLLITWTFQQQSQFIKWLEGRLLCATYVNLNSKGTVFEIFDEKFGYFYRTDDSKEKVTEHKKKEHPFQCDQCMHDSVHSPAHLAHGKLNFSIDYFSIGLLYGTFFRKITLGHSWFLHSSFPLQNL